MYALRIGNSNIMRSSIAIVLIAFSLPVFAQDGFISRDELIRRYAKNEKVKPIDESHYEFRDMLEVEHTPVKAQTGEGSCWSYATNSFLESEMMRAGKQPYNLSNLFSLRCAYYERAESYLRMHGGIAWGEGGEMHDVMNMFALYGAIPEEVYPGKSLHVSAGTLSEMNEELRHYLDAVLDHPGSQMATDWRQGLDAIMVKYIGDAPDKFNFDFHNYNPASFARKCVGVHPEDYIEIGSVVNRPFYKEMTLLVPDNWAFNRVYNVKMEDITEIIDRALSRGYSVAWESDVTEPYFSWDNGVAFVPDKNYDDMTTKEKHELFHGPKLEGFVSAQMRQAGLDNLETTDDHAMHIVGIAEDQNHKKYYKVKNSWGKSNVFGGYIYVTKAYVRLKTSTILLHKSALSVEMRNKLNLGTIGNTRLFFR